MFKTKIIYLPLLAVTVFASALAAGSLFTSVSHATSSASNVASSGGTASWQHVGNVYASDNSYASVDATDKTDYLQSQGFGFSLDSGDTIAGIRANFEGHEEIDPGDPRPWPPTPQVRAQLLNASGSPVGDVKGFVDNYLFNESATDSTRNIPGSTSSIWDEDMSTVPWATDATVVNDADFGVRLWLDYNLDPYVVFIDQVKITVYYTDGETGKAMTQTRTADVLR